MDKLNRSVLHSELYDIFTNLQDLLEDYGIDYFVLGGTLLGAVRDKGIIAHDDDVDIGILNNYDFNLLSSIPDNEFISRNLKRVFTPNNNYIKVFNYINTGDYDIFIDIFPFQILIENDYSDFQSHYNVDDNGIANTLMDDELYGDIITHYKDIGHRSTWNNGYFYVDELFPLKEYEFGPMVIKGPQLPEPYLERHFGEDWRIPKRTHDHLHQVLK